MTTPIPSAVIPAANRPSADIPPALAGGRPIYDPPFREHRSREAAYPESTGAGTLAPVRPFAALTAGRVPCPDCDGEGRITGFATNDPGEKRKTFECERCGGRGDVPGPDEVEDEI